MDTPQPQPDAISLALESVFLDALGHAILRTPNLEVINLALKTAYLQGRLDACKAIALDREAA